MQSTAKDTHIGHIVYDSLDESLAHIYLRCCCIICGEGRCLEEDDRMAPRVGDQIPFSKKWSREGEWSNTTAKA